MYTEVKKYVTETLKYLGPHEYKEARRSRSIGLEELEKNAYGKVALDLGFIMSKTFVRPRGIQREFQMRE